MYKLFRDTDTGVVCLLSLQIID